MKNVHLTNIFQSSWHKNFPHVYVQVQQMVSIKFLPTPITSLGSKNR
jgi:hypothetical protein